MDSMYVVIYDNQTADMCFSLRKQWYTEVDGQREDVGLPERMAVCPGEFDKVEAFAPELLEFFQGVWTENVIAAWQNAPKQDAGGENPLLMLCAAVADLYEMSGAGGESDAIASVYGLLVTAKVKTIDQVPETLTNSQNFKPLV
ncbi:MAG: hypothetical protein FWF44_00065 [Defluviitaleaceae bacterium]|nr:hypothetical protein [Defluviitaleaceae bacterium]